MKKELKNKIKKSPASYEEARRYLESFIDYEKTGLSPLARVRKLERMRFLLKALSLCPLAGKVIHIAGTKGKGSVATYVAWALAACGYRTGLYTSPHFDDFRERIKILIASASAVRSQLIPRGAVADIVGEFRKKLASAETSRHLGKISFFEMYTAVAFEYFKRCQLDYVVLETGLGGRLDATNIATPLISVITHIGYDHTRVLGRRLEQIAAEKAGIIKRGVPVVCARQRPAALGSVKARCKETGSKLYYMGRDFSAGSRRVHGNMSLFDFHFGAKTIGGVKIFQQGSYQIENASLALAALCVLNKSVAAQEKMRIKKGLAQSELEGRFEIIKASQTVIIDIAHNESSFRVLAQALAQYFPGKKIVLVFAASKDKDVKRMLSCIPYDTIILTRFSNPRALSPHQIALQAKIPHGIIAQNINDAFKIARSMCTKGHLILISGSFFLVAEARRLLRTYEKNS
jgi:dihydrofolate synthase/folylpolyglutamate synthase